jgi:hypothetical protein
MSRETDLQSIIDLIPDSFLGGKKPDGNIYRIIKVFVEEINKDMVTLQEVQDLLDIENLFAVNLTLYAAGYGVPRGSKSDANLRLEVIAFRSNSVIGNDVESILSLFRLITGESGTDVQIIEKFESGLANPRPRAFDIVLPNFSDAAEISALLVVANGVKAAGVDVSINDLVQNNFLLQGNGDFLLQGNGDKIIIELGPQT